MEGIAVRAVPATPLYNLARISEERGRPVEAIEDFERFIRESRGDDPDIADQRADARQRIESLERRVGRLEVVCNLEGAEISVDGRVRGRTPLASAIRVEPGRHEIAVRSPAAERPFTDSVEVAAGGNLRVQTYLAPAVAAAPAAAPRPVDLARASEPPPPPPRPIYKRPWFWAAVGVGVVLAAGAVYSTRDRTRPLCDTCDWGTEKIGR
jgi:hypothetical protein